jgi:hypothetical protein
MQALIAKASVVLAIVPRVAITVFSVMPNFQAVSDRLFSRYKTTTIVTTEAMLTITESISNVQDASVLLTTNEAEDGSDFEAVVELYSADCGSSGISECTIAPLMGYDTGS